MVKITHKLNPSNPKKMQLQNFQSTHRVSIIEAAE